MSCYEARHQTESTGDNKEMKISTRLGLAVGILGMCVFTILGVSGEKLRGTEEPQGRTNQALNTIRLINTAEIYQQHEHGKFASLSDLSSSGVLAKVAKDRPQLSNVYSALNLQNQSEMLPGFASDLVVAADGRAYKLSLISKNECGEALFTDQNGLIYCGSALGCAK